MKTLIIIIGLCFTFPQFQVKAQEQHVVPFTMADHDRAARTEMRLEALEIKMDARFAAMETKMDIKFAAIDSKIDTKIDAVNARIDYIFWLMGVVVALMLFMLGYIIRDRRTALKPALERAEAADLRSLSIYQGASGLCKRSSGSCKLAQNTWITIIRQDSFTCSRLPSDLILKKQFRLKMVHSKEY